MSGDRSLKWGCTKCRGDEYADGDELNEVRGCNGKDVSSIGFAFDPSLKQCPWSVIDKAAWEHMRWWAEWVKFKALPWGGVDPMMQPATVLEVFEICETEKQAAEQKQQDEHKAQVEKIKSRSKHGR